MTDATNQEQQKGGKSNQQLITAESNPFGAVAMILTGFRTTLGEGKTFGAKPRWVRIVRIREFRGPKDYIAKGVIPAVEGLNTALWYLVNLTLTAKEMLEQIDSAKALWEVGSEMLKIVTSDVFALAIKRIADPSATKADNVLGGVNKVVEAADQVIGLVPKPEDLDLIGRELYNLLAVKFNVEGKVDLDGTGKFRLIQFGLRQAVKMDVFNGDYKTEVAVAYLGCRLVDVTTAKDIEERLMFHNEVEIFKFDSSLLDNSLKLKKNDVEEAEELLKGLGYLDSSYKFDVTTFQGALKEFQNKNGLSEPSNGQLDAQTINCLLNLKNGTVERAIPKLASHHA